MVNFGFLKKIIKRSKFGKNKCVEYEKLNLNCNSKVDCLDRCINKEFFKEFKSISIHSLFIDKEHFSEIDWRNAFPNFNLDGYNRHKSVCEVKFKNNDCIETHFEKSYDINYDDVGNLSIREIDLYYDVIKLFEDEPTSTFEIIFNIVNIQSIVLGLNVLQILSFLRIQFNLNGKKCLFLIYSVCSIGFISHNYHIFNEIIQSDLVFNQLYETSETIRLPEIIFCFEINQTLIDPKRKLTGYYLDELTRDMRIVFDKIAYLNSSNTWVHTNQQQANNIAITIFYFLNKKCFQITLPEFEYIRDPFYFKDNTEVLRINFQKSILEKKKKIYFLSRIKKTMQFSKLFELIFKTPNKSYSIDQELFTIVQEDKFNLIRNPLSLFYNESDQNDVDKYVDYLILNFKNKYNKSTLNLPLLKENFGLQINDTLFALYFNETDKFELNKPINSNFERQFATNYLEFICDQSDSRPNFTFNLIFFKKVITITNQSNYTKLILNLLNVLIFWFDFTIIDLQLSINKINQFLIAILKSIKNFLINFLNLLQKVSFKFKICRNQIRFRFRMFCRFLKIN